MIVSIHTLFALVIFYCFQETDISDQIKSADRSQALKTSSKDVHKISITMGKEYLRVNCPRFIERI